MYQCIALNYSGVNSSVIELSDQILGSLDVIRSGRVLRLACLRDQHVVERVQIDFNHIGNGSLSKEAIKAGHI